MNPISKSRFLEYLGCPKDAWFRLHVPELEEFKLSETDINVMNQGNIAEDYAKGLKIFAEFVEVKTRDAESRKEIDL